MTPRAYLKVDGGILFPAWAVNHNRKAWSHAELTLRDAGYAVAFSQPHHGFIVSRETELSNARVK